MKVELFVPCIVDQFYPETAYNTIKLLEKVGCEVLFNPEQTCCGLPAYQQGLWDEAKLVGQKFLNDFSEATYIVSPSLACVGMVKKSYDDLFTNALDHNKCRAIQGNIVELSDFLVNIVERDYFGAELEAKAVFHDFCTAQLDYEIKKEPRQLLAQVEGLNLLEFNSPELCCGGGGNLAFNYEALSVSMAQRICKEALALQAEYIIANDMTCLIHLQSYINQEKLAIKTIHLADVLTSGWANL